MLVFTISKLFFQLKTVDESGWADLKFYRKLSRYETLITFKHLTVPV